MFSNVSVAQRLLVFLRQWLLSPWPLRQWQARGLTGQWFKGKWLTKPVLFLCTFSLTALLGLGLAHATTTPYGMVDPIPPEQATGYGIYIERCATCHVALPPAVLPTQTWQTLVTDPAHYGVALPAIDRFDQQLMLNYLQVYSRRHQARGALPYRLNDSAYFQAMHPAVELPQPLNIRSCAGCHIGASEQDYSGAFE